MTAKKKDQSRIFAMCVKRDSVRFVLTIMFAKMKRSRKMSPKTKLTIAGILIMCAVALYLFVELCVRYWHT